MASSDILCGICEGQHITKLAEHWCPECEEGICSECKIQHGISKFTKHHEAISVENFKKLPKYISSNVHHCKEHEKVYTIYCPRHEHICCPVCVEKNHSRCVDLLAIDNFLKTAKSSALLDSIIDNIQITKKNLKQLLEQQDENLMQNKQNCEKILAEVKDIRRGINSHFDQLEEKIAKELATTEEKIKLDICKISSDLRDKSQAIEKLEHDIVSIKQYASDLQTFFGSMTLKEKFEEIQNYIISKKAEGKLKKKLLKCDIRGYILDETAAIKTLGTVTVEELPLNIEMIENKLAQMAYTTKFPINKINVTLIKKWNVPKGKKDCDITGHVIRPDGKIILVDRANNERLLILTEDGKLEKEMTFPSGSKPNDVTSVDDKTICVSFDGNRLELIDTVTFKTTQAIKTNNPCCGVTSHNGNLIWFQQWKGVQMKQKCSDTITTLVKDESGSYWSFLTVRDNMIYQTHAVDGAIICYKTNGEKIWEFKDKDVISQPWGITVDNYSNIILSSLRSEIVVLAANRTKHRHILTKENGLSRALALYYDRKNNILLVSNTSGEIFFYSVS